VAVSKTSYTEEELITFIKKGESAYFRHLVDRHKSYVYTLALRVVCSHEDAQEVAQDSFVKAYNNISSFKGDAKFSTWLYRIVFNTAISKKRKKRLPETDIEKASGVLDADGMNSSELLSQKERRAWVNKAIERLPEDDAFLITLYYFQELTLEEIEKITGFTPNNVKVKIFRARKKLAEWLGKCLQEEITSLT
jgi:RNA polymerase sigma factor (sigma-70 family)